MAIAVATLPRDKSAKRRIVPPSAATARLETVLVAEVPGLVRAVFSTLADRQPATGQIDVVDVFTNASIDTRNGLPRGKLENGCRMLPNRPQRVSRDQAPPTAPTRRNIHGLTRLLR
jgi:hypothetical protein